jgi:AcrR family transcriptional regulator
MATRTPKKAPAAKAPARDAGAKARPAGRAPVGRADPERFPSGRRRVPLGVREGGEAWDQVHVQLARQALRLMAELGYAGMGMDEVAAAAGASPRTVYRHYPSKVDLAVAGIEQLPTMAGWYDGDDAIENRIARAMDIGAAHHEYLVPVLANAIVFRNTVPQLLDAIRDHVLLPRRDVIAASVTRSKAAGEIAQDVSPDFVATLILGELVESFVGIHPLGSARQRIDYVMRRVWPRLRA